MAQSSNFGDRWKGFTGALYKLIKVRLDKPGPFFKPFGEFIEEAFRYLLSDDFVREIASIWGRFKSEPGHGLEARLPEMEMLAFENGYETVTGQKSTDQSKHLSRRKWRSTAHTARQMLNVGRTIVQSVWNALEPLLSTWISGLLKILDEAIAIMA